jgi:hypothetical protein
MPATCPDAPASSGTDIGNACADIVAFCEHSQYGVYVKRACAAECAHRPACTANFDCSGEATKKLKMAAVAQGESVIKCLSPLNALKYTYDHSYY